MPTCRLLLVAALTCALLVPGTVAAVEVTGGTCVAVSSEYWIWSDYNDAIVRAKKRGEPTDPDSMRKLADKRQRTSWRSLPWKKWANASGIAVRTGFVERAEKSNWGAIPRDADIEVSLLADWTVHGEYGWLLTAQPRVEVETKFQMAADYKGGISFVNDIMLHGTGFISGTAGQPRPWPQLGEHSVHLVAVDIKGRTLESMAQLHATAMPSTTTGSTEGGFNIWQVSAGANYSKAGPTATAGVAYSAATSYTRTEGTAVPAVPAAKVSRSHPAKTTMSVGLDCGKGVTLRRLAQVSGNLTTVSYRPGGSISTSATYNVSNTLKAAVSCELCDEGDDGEPDPDPVPEPVPEDPVPPGEEGGPKEKPVKTYGTRPKHPLDPIERNGLYYTPVHGGSVSPRTFWNDPLADRVGSIYVTREGLPDFVVPLPLSERDRAAEIVERGKVPLLMPDVEWTHVAVADVGATPTLRPARGTKAFILPWANQVVFDGPFSVEDPVSGVRHDFGGEGFVAFPTAARPTIPGGAECVLGPGEEIRTERDGSRLTNTIVNRRGEVTGAFQQDDRRPDVVFFDRALYRPVPGVDSGEEEDEPPHSRGQSPE